MAIMVSVIVLMSWYFFAVLFGSMKADSNTTEFSGQRQHTAARDEFPDEVLTWTCPVDYSTAYLSESEKWNAFIHSLYCNFSDYEIQGSERKYDLADRANFLKEVQSNDEVKRAYDIVKLADELYSLEEHDKMLTENVELRPLYQSLLKRISVYAHNFTDDPYLYKKALGFLYAATLSREHNFDDESVSSVILNISYYLDSAKNNIAILKNLQNSNTQKDAINEHKEEDSWENYYKFQLAINVMNKYKEDEWKINMKFKEVMYILNEILPEMDNIANQTNSQIELLLDDVIYLQKEVNEIHEELYQKKEELGNMLMLQNFNAVLNVFGSIIGFLGQIGAAAFSIIETGSTVSETLSFNTGSVNNAAKQSAAQLELLKDNIKVIRDQRIGYLKKSLESISQETSKYPDTFSDISVKMSHFESRLNKISGEKIARYDLNEIQNVETELKATLEEKRETFLSQSTDREIENELVAIQNMQNVFQFSSVVLDTCNAHSSNEAKCGIIHEIIQQNERNFYKLKQYEDKIYNTVVPMLQNIQNDIDGIVSNTAKKSNVILDVVKWNVQSTLKYAMAQMKQLTGEFKVLDKFIYFIENMIETAVILINAYDHVQDFEKEQAIAKFVEEIESSTVSSTSRIRNTILESYLKHTIHDLQMMLSSSIVVQQYKKTVDAFKHFIFPFADIYLYDVVLPTHLVLDPNKDRNMLGNLTNKAETGIRNINSNLKYVEEPRSFCTGDGEFSSRYKSTKPFFVWKNAEHRQMISKLLSGGNVTLKADVTHSPFDKDAIKFNVVKFRFKAKDERNQLKIDNAMYGFGIWATHLGNSYYRYNNKIYLMTTPAISIAYDLDKGDGFHRNAVYDKLKNGEFMLSPYATWTLELKDAKGKSFSSLKMFRNEIDLELEGYGQYIDKVTHHCSNLNVGEYYKAIDKYYNGN